jgi:glycosyltransferase involved in cell wall biosynthesis
LKVAYDLRYASDHFGGTGTHAHALLATLLEQPGDERYHVLWNPALRQTRYDFTALRSHPRVSWIERPWGPLSIASLFHTGRWLRDVRPSVYFSPFYLMPFMPGCPTVVTLHDVRPLRTSEPVGWITRALYRASIRRAAAADTVVTSSAFSFDEIKALAGIPDSRLRVARPGRAPRAADVPARRPGALPDEPFALVVGDNRPHKNLETIVRAWAAFGSSPPFALVSAGAVDPRYPSCSSLATSMGARGVTGLGWVDASELEWLYAHASLVLFPSLYEGFGFPLVEAFGHGAVVIASAIPTLLETGAGAARFEDPCASEQWAAAVRALARDDGERARLSLAGLARAGELTYRRTGEEVLDVLRRVART